MFRLLGIVFVIGSATAIAGPSGRVVRVERTSGAPAVAPRLCVLHSDSGMCIGDQPRVGQTVTMLNDRHVVAEVQIVEATSAATSCSSLWKVKTQVVHGIAAAGEQFGVIDPRLDPSRAHVLDRDHVPASPSGSSTDEVWQAIDRDGDGTADIIITKYSCDTSGTPVAGGPTFCIDVWSRVGAKMSRTTQLNFAQCNP